MTKTEELRDRVRRHLRVFGELPEIIYLGLIEHAMLEAENALGYGEKESSLANFEGIPVMKVVATSHVYLAVKVRT